MQKRAILKYDTVFAPLPTPSATAVYYDKKQISLPYAEDFPKLHYHDRYEIGVCEEGEGLFLSEGEFFAVSPGDIIFIAPGRRHYSRSLSQSDTAKCRFAYINAELVHNITGEPSELYVPAVISPRELSLAAELLSALELCFSGSPSAERIAILRLCVFILSAKEQNFERRGVKRVELRESPSARAAEYISLHYMENVSSAELAKMFHISESQLRRGFVSLCGEPPIAYKNSLRFAVACELLQKSRMSVAEIAEKVGYGSAADFYRAFKGKLGIPPSEYRKQRKNF